MPTLKARIGGAWVPVGGGAGADEVFIGSTAPGVGAGYELWVDPTTSTGVQTTAGYVGHAELAADQLITTPTTWTDVTGVAVTWTADPTHRYKTTAHVSYQKSTATGDAFFGIFDQSNNVIDQAPTTPATASAYGSNTVTIIETGLSGSQTRKLRAYVGTNGVGVFGRAGTRTRILVEDITPVNSLSTNRVICTSGSRPTGLLGLEIYETDTKRNLVYDGTRWVITYEPIQTWTPTFTGLTFGNGTINQAQYWRTGNLCFVRAEVIFGSSTTVTGWPQVNNLPVPPNIPGGSGQVPGMVAVSVDTSASTNYVLDCLITGGTSMGLVWRGTNSAMAFVSATSPFTWAVGDTIRWQMMYPCDMVG